MDDNTITHLDLSFEFTPTIVKGTNKSELATEVKFGAHNALTLQDGTIISPPPSKFYETLKLTGGAAPIDDGVVMPFDSTASWSIKSQTGTVVDLS